MEKPRIAIYDEKPLQRQLLHHDLERLQYEILYCCASHEEFVQSFQIHPADIILFNAECGMEKAESILAQVQLKKNLSIVFYYAEGNDALAHILKTNYHADAFFCSGTWENIISMLDWLSPMEPLLQETGRLPLSPDNPFHKIVENKACVRILQLLSEGKNIKQVSAITVLPESAINYHLKKMKHDTGCSSVVELVLDARDSGII
ncbi:MAG TPA: hypothetical protein VI757_10070 [Bacteroidia bacterium]|nr:hypothetical protein [Bacteroidia bacterium]